MLERGEGGQRETTTCSSFEVALETRVLWHLRTIREAIQAEVNLAVVWPAAPQHLASCLWVSYSISL